MTAGSGGVGPIVRFTPRNAFIDRTSFSRYPTTTRSSAASMAREGMRPTSTTGIPISRCERATLVHTFQRLDVDVHRPAVSNQLGLGGRAGHVQLLAQEDGFPP